jgi:hypothetical protein
VHKAFHEAHGPLVKWLHVIDGVWQQIQYVYTLQFNTTVAVSRISKENSHSLSSTPVTHPFLIICTHKNNALSLSGIQQLKEKSFSLPSALQHT